MAGSHIELALTGDVERRSVQRCWFDDALSPWTAQELSPEAHVASSVKSSGGGGALDLNLASCLSVTSGASSAAELSLCANLAITWATSPRAAGGTARTASMSLATFPKRRPARRWEDALAPGCKNVNSVASTAEAMPNTAVAPGSHDGGGPKTPIKPSVPIAVLRQTVGIPIKKCILRLRRLAPYCSSLFRIARSLHSSRRAFASSQSSGRFTGIDSPTYVYSRRTVLRLSGAACGVGLQPLGWAPAHRSLPSGTPASFNSCRAYSTRERSSETATKQACEK